MSVNVRLRRCPRGSLARMIHHETFALARLCRNPSSWFVAIAGKHEQSDWKERASRAIRRRATPVGFIASSFCPTSFCSPFCGLHCLKSPTERWARPNCTQPNNIFRASPQPSKPHRACPGGNRPLHYSRSQVQVRRCVVQKALNHRGKPGGEGRCDEDCY